MGFVLHSVRGGRRGPGPHPEVYPEMNTDARDSSIVWPVFRREDMGPKRAGLIHFQGVGVASAAETAREMAFRMCNDETYFTFPVPVNTNLPEKPWRAKGLVWPCRAPASQPEVGVKARARRSRAHARKAGKGGR